MTPRNGHLTLVHTLKHGAMVPLNCSVMMYPSYSSVHEVGQVVLAGSIMTVSRVVARHTAQGTL